MFTYSFLMALLLQVARAHSNSKPHIIIIMADDLGWNDVSFHGSDQITTPNIDALAYNGIILNSHYVPALCTPSRSSLLTGKYPTTTGMQHLVILAPEPWGLPLSERLMPEYLRDAGYRTHAIGKWHLGFYKKEYTPTYRGFDQHYGYWNGFHDYYDHSMKATFAPYQGYDMRRNMTTDWSAIGKYTTDLFTNEAVDVIHAHDASKAPLFMYVAHLAPHTGNENDPFQAPDEEIAKFGHIDDPERRVYAAMVSKVDQSVGEIMTALRTKGMLDNSIVLFLSDNGAPTHGLHSNRGSNWPLRGMKSTPMEGGVRGVGAIWSPLLNSTQRVSNQLMHISDWLPTFYSAAGLNVKDLGRIDGFDMWAALSENLPSPRTEVLHNIDDIANYSSIRNGDWKYTSGASGNGKSDWYGESGIEDLKAYTTPKYDVDSVLRSPTGTAILGLITKLQIKEKENRFAKIIENDSRQDIQKKTQLKFGGRRRLLSRSIITTLRQEAQITCLPLNKSAVTNSTECRALDSPCLFNVRSDPCEMINLAAIHPLIVARLEASLLRLRRSTVAPLNVPSDPAANPVNWEGVWTSWLDDVEEELPSDITPPPFSPVLILTILASLFGVIILVLIAIILRIYLCRMPESCSLISLFLFKDGEEEDSAKHKTVE